MPRFYSNLCEFMKVNCKLIDSKKREIEIIIERLNSNFSVENSIVNLRKSLQFAAIDRERSITRNRF